MVFPVGATMVRCTQCWVCTPTPAPEAYTCRCGLYLRYASTIATLVCTVCYTVRPPPAPVTATLAPLTPLGISPAAAAALHMPYLTAPLRPGFHAQLDPTAGASASPYDLLPSTPVLAAPGPRPAPIPRAVGRPPSVTPSRQLPANGSARTPGPLSPPSTSALVPVEAPHETVLRDEEHPSPETEQPRTAVIRGAAEELQRVPRLLAREYDSESRSMESRHDPQRSEAHEDKRAPPSEGPAGDDHIDRA
jgi:hypothetical protein